MKTAKNAISNSQQVVNRCKVCGEPNMIIIDFPALDGTGALVKKKVHCMCKCEIDERAEFERRMRLEAEKRKVKTLRRLSLLDNNKDCKNARFSTYKVDENNQKQYGIAMRYVQNFGEMLRQGQGLLLYGPPGTGKSYTAAAIANELLDRTVSVVMTSFIKLIDEMQRQTYERNEPTYLDRINRAKLLIIDDLGAERGTEYALEKVYDIVDSRHRDGKPVVFTTNLTMQQLKEAGDIRYSRIYDRIFEMCYPVKFSGSSHRKHNAAKRYIATQKLLEGE